MSIFRKKNKQSEGITEQKFDIIVGLIKDLPRADYNRFKDAMDYTYNGYQKLRNVKTIEEKEVEDIDDIEKKLETIDL